MRSHHLTALLAALLLLAACGPTARQTAHLRRADSLVAANPAEALRLTDSLLSEGSGDAHWQAQLRLRRLNAINMLDTVFTAAHVVQAKTLADHFDRHGTANERMLAHYLLGRAYADLGEAPQAIDCYHDAVSCADTIATDCDYYTLCRVYSQMAELFYRQDLFANNLHFLDLSISYAWKANDTIAALNSYAQKMGTYDRLNVSDSVIAVSEQTYRQFQHLGKQQTAAKYIAPAIKGFLSKKDFKKAKQYIQIYETKSGYFDKYGNIEKGREAYYYIKGQYFLAIQQYDSAKHFFLKELSHGQDFNNQNMASKGLAKLFHQTDQPDSAAKYALYSYDMNDSVYAHMATTAVAKMQAMYNYTRHQREAQQAKEREEAIRNKAYILICFLLLILVLSIAGVRKYRQAVIRQKKLKEKYDRLLDRQKGAERELKELQSYKEEYNELLNKLIKDKESEIVALEEELASIRLVLSQHPEGSETEINILNSVDFYLPLVKSTGNGHKLTATEWDTLHGFIKERLPKFGQFIANRKFLLTNNEVCILILARLYFKPKNMANALGLDASIVTRVRQSLHKKIFGTSGSSKLFDQTIRHIDKLVTIETES